jgi:phage shock protein A
MKIGFSNGANKGGQQPSQLYYPANLKTRYLHTQTITEAGRFSTELNRQIAELETRVSYRKQRPAICSNRQKMQKSKLQFSTVSPAFSALPESLHPMRARARAAQSIVEAHGPRQTSKASMVQFDFGAQ